MAGTFYALKTRWKSMFKCQTMKTTPCTASHPKDSCWKGGCYYLLCENHAKVVNQKQCLQDSGQQLLLTTAFQLASKLILMDLTVFQWSLGLTDKEKDS